MKYGPELMRQADILAGFTSDAPRITRTYLSPEHRQAGDYLIGLMRGAGMEAGFDALGNIVGRYAGAKPDAPVLMTGSHQDSVRNAGRYDGLFGILTAIACVGDLNRRGVRLPHAVEVVGFGDEEGVRFGITLIGSKAMAGAFDPAWLDKTDDTGVTLRQALAEFGGDPAAWATLDRRGRDVAAFVESHIEQGPVLLDAGVALGVVSAIAGATRLKITVTGLAGHAGTVPMGTRRDALAAAAEMVLAVETYCERHRGEGGLVGTVGMLEARPGAANVIPQDVVFSVDVRSGNDVARCQAVAALAQSFRDIAARRRVEVRAHPYYEADAAPCDPRLQARFAEAIRAQGIPVRTLPSGAGHDAMVFPAICPTAMLFVRCGNGGISHHPDEIMTAEDGEAATLALLHFIENFDAARP